MLLLTCNTDDNYPATTYLNIGRAIGHSCWTDISSSPRNSTDTSVILREFREKRPQMGEVGVACEPAQ